MRIVTGLETVKEQIKNNKVSKVNATRYIQYAIDYIGFLESDRKKLNEIRIVVNDEYIVPLGMELVDRKRILNILEEEQE